MDTQKRWKVAPGLDLDQLLNCLKGMTVAQKAVALGINAAELRQRPLTTPELIEFLDMATVTVERALPGLCRVGLVVCENQ